AFDHDRSRNGVRRTSQTMMPAAAVHPAITAPDEGTDHADARTPARPEKMARPPSTATTQPAMTLPTMSGGLVSCTRVSTRATASMNAAPPTKLAPVATNGLDDVTKTTMDTDSTSTNEASCQG